MVRDDLTARAVGEPLCEGAVEAAQSPFQSLGFVWTAELVADPLDEHGVPKRVEPDVDVAVLQAVEAGRVQHVEDVLAVSRGVFELRLEAVSEEHARDLRRGAPGRRLASPRDRAALLPAGVRLRTRTESPPISAAANASG